MPFTAPHLRVGVSARIYYPAKPVLDLGGVWTKTLHYLEQSVAHWLLRGGALPMMIPAVEAQSITAPEALNLATMPTRSTRWCCRAATMFRRIPTVSSR